MLLEFMQQASWGQTEIVVSLSAQPLVSGSPCRWSTAIDAAAVQIARSHVATELPKAFLISMQRKLVESNANANAPGNGNRIDLSIFVGRRLRSSRKPHPSRNPSIRC